MKVPCCPEVSEVEFGEGAGHAVRRCQRLSLVKVPCCQEVSEVEFGEGVGIVVKTGVSGGMKVPALLSESVRGR